MFSLISQNLLPTQLTKAILHPLSIRLMKGCKAQKAKDSTMDKARETKDATSEKACEYKDYTSEKSRERQDTTVYKIFELKDSTVGAARRAMDFLIGNKEETKEATEETSEAAKHKSWDTMQAAKEKYKETTKDARRKMEEMKIDESKWGHRLTVDSEGTPMVVPVEDTAAGNTIWLLFNSLSGQVFASFWLLLSTLAVSRAFLYLSEARVDKQNRSMAKWVLGQDMTVA